VSNEVDIRLENSLKKKTKPVRVIGIDRRTTSLIVAAVTERRRTVSRAHAALSKQQTGDFRPTGQSLPRCCRGRG